jgi:hypothetical protein
MVVAATGNVLVALVGAGGAVIGALASVTGTVLNQLVLERRQRAREHGSAIRRVEAELTQAEAVIATAVAEQSLSPSLAGHLATPEWDDCRKALAISLGAEQWDATRDAFAAIAALRHTVGDADGRVDAARQKAREALYSVRSGREALART